MLIVAKRQENLSTRYSRARDLAYRSNVLYRNGGGVQSDHRWSLRGMGCIPQCHFDEFVLHKLVFDFILSASITHDFLLFLHRPLFANQGNKTMSSCDVGLNAFVQTYLFATSRNKTSRGR